MTYLFTWNAAKTPWDTLDEDIEKCRRQGFWNSDWSCGRNKNIERGDRFFLIRLGPQRPSGILGSGFVTSSYFEEQHWLDPKKTAIYVDLYFDMLLHPDKEPLLTLSLLKERLPDTHWTPQSSGMTISPEAADRLEYLWNRHLESLNFSPIQLSEEIATPERYFEGALSQITVNSYERNPRARSTCIAYHGCKCFICGFDFEQVFGGIGKGFIHVHHRESLAEIGEEYEIDPEKDLIPLCPNCHAMIHRMTPPYTCENLKTLCTEIAAQKPKDRAG